MTDIVERLRSPHLQIDSNEVRVLVAEIADEIERLRRVARQMAEALQNADILFGRDAERRQALAAWRELNK